MVEICYDIHRTLRPGLLESVFVKSIIAPLQAGGENFQRISALATTGVSCLWLKPREVHGNYFPPA